jgi:hypothetical protein
MENNLSMALQLAETWKAIVLIDEADVFLEQRSAHDLKRNGLVSSKSYFLCTVGIELTQIVLQYSFVFSNITKEFFF